MGYFNQTVKGVSWIGVLRVVSRILVTGRLAILARIFAPSEFGAFAIATLVLAFFEVVTETGINVYLVQEKKHISKYLNEAWLVSMIRGTVIGLLIFLSAKPVSEFFNSPNAYELILLTAVIPFIKGFINPSIVLFQKDLKFHSEFVFRSIILLFESIAMVAIALVTKSVSSMIWGFVFSALVEVALSFMYVKPWPSFTFRYVTVKDIFTRGKWVTLFGIFAYLAKEGDNAVVGKIIDLTALGIYQMGYKISTLVITEITEVASKVTFPIFVRVSDDPRRLFAAYFKSTGVIVVATLCIGIPLILFTKPIVLIALGGKWLGAVPVIKILTVYGIIRAISGYAATLFLAVQKQNFAAFMTIARFLGLAIVVVPLTYRYGIIGTGYSALVSVAVELPVVLYFLYKIFHDKQKLQKG